MVPGSQAAAASVPRAWVMAPLLGFTGPMVPWSSHVQPDAPGLFVVKNRLPPSLEQLPPEPLLTEEDTRQPATQLAQSLEARAL